jgi:sucrose phosphorylase
VVKLMRDVLEAVAPGVVLLTETNVPHKENLSYFGEGDEARMVYQFPLPPLLLHGLRRGDASRLTAWASALDAPPEGCTFFNFTASHDGVGVRPLEGLVPMEEVKVLAEEIRALGGKVNERSHPDGSTTPYEINTSYFSAMRKEGQSEELHLRRFLLSQTVPMCLQGIPAFYIHSFTATENDLEGMARTGQNRSINRKQWDESELLVQIQEYKSATATVLDELVRRLNLRSTIKEFHPDIPQEILNFGEKVFALKRGNLLALHNFSDEPVTIPLNANAILLGDQGCSLMSGKILLAPCTLIWAR